MDPARTIVQLVKIDETGDSYYRMRWPAREIAIRHPTWTVVNLDAAAAERFKWGLEADLLVIYQSSDVDLLRLIDRRKKLGRPTLVEYNDNFYEPPRWSPVAEPWSSPLLWQCYELIMNSADALMVTGPGLKELFSPLTAVPIVELHNNLPFELAVTLPKNSDRIRIGWAGSLGHAADIIAVQPVIREIISEFPNVVFSFMGNQALHEIFRLPPDRIEFTNWGSMQDYFSFWEKIQIGIAPLLDTAYNRGRSDIKAVEMSGAAAVPVLQRSLPYQHFIKETDAPSFSNNADLLKCIRFLLQNRSECDEIAQKVHKYTVENRIETKRRERENLYLKFLTNLPARESELPFPAGYHEITGTTETLAASTEALKNVGLLLKAGEMKIAGVELDKLATEHWNNPDVQFVRYRVNTAVNAKSDVNKYTALQKQFPRDLRFSFLAAARLEGGDLKRCLTCIIDTLSKLPIRNRHVFRRDAIELLKLPVLAIEQVRPVAELFPNSPEVQMILAERLHIAGKEEEASAAYSVVCDQLESAELCDDLRKSVSSSALAALVEGLSRR